MSLYNMPKDAEVTKAILDAFRALEVGAHGIQFKGEGVAPKTNSQGEVYYELAGALDVRFRVYTQNDQGVSRVMIVIRDLFRKTGEAAGQATFSNPIIWGQCKRNKFRGESLYFFDDSAPRLGGGGRRGFVPRISAERLAALAASVPNT
jgi:hypothetical protein